MVTRNATGEEPNIIEASSSNWYSAGVCISPGFQAIDTSSSILYLINMVADTIMGDYGLKITEYYLHLSGLEMCMLEFLPLNSTG